MNLVIPIRLERAAALGLLGFLVSGLAAIVVSSLTAVIHSETEQRHLLLKQAAALQGLVEAESTLHDVLARIDAHPMWQRIYSDPSNAAADASFQKDFRALADAQAISVDMLQPMEPVGENKFTHLGLRVGFSTSIDHLAQLLSAMQAAPHFMKFENLYVTSPMNQSDAGNPLLVVRGDVVAYRMAEDSQ